VSAASPDELIYDEAVRAVGRQQATASELRNGASLPDRDGCDRDLAAG
jgi:hypothetical protein